MEVSSSTQYENFKKKSNLIFIINACAYLFFFIFGYISIVRYPYSDLFLNLFMNFSLNSKSVYELSHFMGLKMDNYSLFAFYISILFICVINFITLIKYFVKKSNLENYFNRKFSQFIFIPLFFFTILNFFGYKKMKSHCLKIFIISLL
jgi:hypothetical protein